MKLSVSNRIVLVIGMTYILTLSSVALGGPQTPARPRSLPRVINTTTTQSVVLGDAVQAALSKYDRTFQALGKGSFNSDFLENYNPEWSANQLPWAVSGDFNGDGWPDIAVMGKSQNNSVVVNAILSTSDPAKFNVRQVHKWPCRDDVIRCRDFGPNDLRVKNWPRGLRLAEKGEIRARRLRTNRDYVKYEAFSNDQGLFILTDRGFRLAPAPMPRRKNPRAGGASKP